MYSEVQYRINKLVAEQPASSLSGRRLGLEKETLRIDKQGCLAQTDHPVSLGSALCNSQVTTDFSESLLEMVTPPCSSAAQALDYLTNLHQFILQRIPTDEGLWNTSMPCVLNNDDNHIRIGQYGHSHNGVMKHAYRNGLALRYGRRMQSIAGIHFNFSMPTESWSLWQGLHGLPDFATEQARSTQGYFHMTRNLMRVGWLVPYLFGASPAICQTFLSSGMESDLETLNQHTRYAPYGTSLRMGEIGYRYKDNAPIDLSVRHDSFDHYLEDILAHVTSVHPAYEELGVKNAEGQYQQLSASRLQIENEYYSSVRPKQIPEDGEMPILALKRRGIRYLELRSVDVNVFDQAGMNLEQIAMLEMLMLFAWLADSPPLLAEEMELNKRNVHAVAHRGRLPDLLLEHGDQLVSLPDWGNEVLSALKPLAQWLDSNTAGEQSGTANLYQSSLQMQLDKLANPDLTPSAQVVAALPKHGSFLNFVLAQSEGHQTALQSVPTNPELQSTLEGLVAESLAAQKLLEDNAEGSFESFLKGHFEQLKNNS